jgi:ABC-type Na+ transport system ATPase subunit NatA
MLKQMIRMKINLTEEQTGALKRMAAERKISMAAMIRELLDAAIARARREPDRVRALQALRRGGFRSGRPNLTERHDDELADAYLE